MSLESRDLLEFSASVDPPDPLDPLDCPVLMERLVVMYVVRGLSHVANAPTIHTFMMHCVSG